MKYRIFILLLLLSIQSEYFSPLFGQVNEQGNPLIELYDYAQTGGSEWNYSLIKDNRGILYFGNEIQGVIEFDGVNWNKIRINDNPVILNLEIDPDGIIYVGGPYEFGYLEPSETGLLEYVSVSSRIDSVPASTIGDVYDSQYFEGDVYFVSKRTIYRYNSESDFLDTINAADKYFTLQKAFAINDQLFIADNREGLTELVGDSLRLLPGGEAFGRDYCFAVLPYDSTSCLVGTYFNGLHLYNYKTGEIRRNFVSAEDNESLKASQIYNGVVLDDGNFAFGTRVGMYIFNRDGKLVDLYTNKSVGLHDDQIYALYHDETALHTSHLWMTVVEKIYRISYNLPIRYFDDRNNITFPIKDVCRFNGEIYAGGDKGVIKREFKDNKTVFKEIEGINSQTFSLTPYESSGRKFLLVGTFEGLYIIDENDKVSRFIDIMANPTEDYTLSFIHSMGKSIYRDGVFYQGLGRQIREIEYSGGSWYYRYSVKGLPGKVQSLVEESANKLWALTIDMDRLFTIDISVKDTTIVKEYSGSELKGTDVKSIRMIGGEILLVTNSSIFKYNTDSAKFISEPRYMLDGNNDVIYEDIVDLGDKGVFVSCFDFRNFDYIVKPDGSKIIDPFFLLPKSYTANMMLEENLLWLPKQQEIYLIDLNKIDSYSNDNSVLIRKVVIGADSIIFNGAFFEEGEDGVKRLLKHQPKSQVRRINHSYNDVRFNWASTNLMSGDSTVYSFMIEGFDDGWSKWDNVNYKDYTNLQYGKYKFKIKAKGLTRYESEETVYEFEIIRAWYQTFFAMIAYLILIILFIVGIIKVYTRRLINENIRLEGIVNERTKEVVRQKEELEASIHYASRIQRAILPSEKALKDKVEEYFILFRPRDIVSGDFYWVSEKGSRLYIVAADCTGHGVPGAFMSILGINFLDEIINKAESTETDEILNSLRKHVTDSLKQMEEGVEETKDGMDLGILVVNREDNEIEYSGAYNPCWVVRELSREEKEAHINGDLEMEKASLTNGEYLLETIEADRMPIGVSSRMDQSFKMHKQALEKGVSYYLLSDGYSDQFGGENGRKFLKKNLKKLVLEVQGLPMKQQRDLLEKRLLDWMGDQDQVDDILVMGIRVI